MVTTPGMAEKKSNITLIKRLFQGAFVLLLGYLSIQTALNTPKKHAINELYQQQKSDVFVVFEAEVTKLLADDVEGDRHQKFIVSTGKNTVLIAHNIDLAKRVPVKVGDELIIRGEYEWNSQGGVVHWTHHDPQNRHPGGWIEHDGKKFK